MQQLLNTSLSPATPALPAAGVAVPNRQGLRLMPGPRCAGCTPIPTPRERHTTIQLLRSLAVDSGLFFTIRARAEMADPSVRAIPIEQAIAKIADLLITGRLHFCPIALSAGGGGGGNPQPELQQATEPYRRERRVVEPEAPLPDPCFLSPMLDAEVQYATLLAAAEIGIPYCEECERLAREKVAQKCQTN
jgi:hypothetical protein